MDYHRGTLQEFMAFRQCMIKRSMATQLVVLIDLNAPKESLMLPFLSTLIETIKSFLKAFIILNDKNKCTIILTFGGAQKWIFCTSEDRQEPSLNYYRFEMIDKGLKSGIEEVLGKGGSNPNMVSSFLSTLAYLSKTKGHEQQRILIIQTSFDSNHRYRDIMNGIFAAQKAEIIIDGVSCHSNENSIVQRITSMTGGFHLASTKTEEILSWLMYYSLLDKSARAAYVVPKQKPQVVAATCFCHQKKVRLGFVCSVCLSVFCKFIPVCSTCRTKFDFDLK